MKRTGESTVEKNMVVVEKKERFGPRINAALPLWHFLNQMSVSLFGRLRSAEGDRVSLSSFLHA